MNIILADVRFWQFVEFICHNVHNCIEKVSDENNNWKKKEKKKTILKKENKNAYLRQAGFVTHKWQQQQITKSILQFEILK